MRKDLIVSLAVDGRERYSDLVKGLEKSIIDARWQGDVRIYKEWEPWMTPHKEIPYAFKYDIIQKAIEDQYKRIIWLDSVMRLVSGKYVDDLLTKSNGIMAFHNLGHSLTPFITDKAVENLNVQEEQLDNIPHSWGGAIGFDFQYPVTRQVFHDIVSQARIGSFNEGISKRASFISARHDQSVNSVIFWKHGIKLWEYGIIASVKNVDSNTIIQYGD